MTIRWEWILGPGWGWVIRDSEMGLFSIETDRWPNPLEFLCHHASGKQANGVQQWEEREERGNEVKGREREEEEEGGKEEWQ